MTAITVISVLYKGGDTVPRWAAALDVARSHPDLEISVIAVDNASGDGTPERLRAAAPWVTVRALETNVGFAAGCNLGMAGLAPDALIVLLNPDVAVDAGFFTGLLNISWSDDLAAVGPQIRTPTGEIEQSARAFPSAITGAFGRATLMTKLFPRSAMARRQLLASPADGRKTVDWVSGACLIAPAERFRRVGGLDEGYWMYWEDADWCRRATVMGLRVEYRPELVVVHHQGASSASSPLRTLVAFHRSAARYYRLHVARSPIEACVAAGALLARLAVKLVVGAAKAGLRRRGVERHDDDG